jgi:hypothetical protein
MVHLSKAASAIILLLLVAVVPFQSGASARQGGTSDMMQDLIKAAGSLGHDSETVRADKGKGAVMGVMIKRASGGWVWCYRSARPGWVILRIRLAKPSGAVPLDKLGGLLAANDTTDPSYFGYSKSDNVLFIETPVAQGSIDSRVLERAISHMDLASERNERLWNPKRWSSRKKEE